MANFEVHIKLDNTDKIKNALPEQIEKALTAIGMACETFAKRDCPVDTGRLRNSITYKVRTGEKTVYIGTDVEYGKYVELGTSRMSAQPFLGPAATQHTADYKALAEQALKG